MALNDTLTKHRKKRATTASAATHSKLDKQLQDEIIERLTKHFAIKHIILFGSYANGAPHEDSDVDLVVVLDQPGMAENYDQRLNQKVKVSRVLLEIRKKIPMDILVYTRDEWKKVLSMNFSFFREIQNSGIYLL